MDFVTTIKGYTLEYIDNEHIYLVNGVIVPSITQILKSKFGNKYNNVRRDVLERARVNGTQTHDAIEKYCKEGIECDLKELHNFKFLMGKYKFTVKGNEIPVILFKDGKPISAGRLDLVLELDGKIGGADIKRTATLDKEYLAYQLNLYRIAYRQCYGIEWEFLRGLHLRDDKRKFVEIPINEDKALELVNNYLMEVDYE